jgi:putative transposase
MNGYNSKTAGSAKFAEPPLQRRLDPMDFRRKNIRLHPTRYRGRAWFFITIRCELRKPIFSESKNAQMLVGLLKNTAERHQFGIHAFCVMPDHFHALVEGVSAESDLLLLVRNFKQTSSREYSIETAAPLWQKKFYDHILRAGESHDAVSWYIWMNPVRKRLCTEPTQYPFSGSFTEDWKKKVQPLETWTPSWKQPQVARP